MQQGDSSPATERAMRKLALDLAAGLPEAREPALRVLSYVEDLIRFWVDPEPGAKPDPTRGPRLSLVSCGPSRPDNTAESSPETLEVSPKQQ